MSNIPHTVFRPIRSRIRSAVIVMKNRKVSLRRLGNTDTGNIFPYSLHDMCGYSSPDDPDFFESEFFRDREEIPQNLARMRHPLKRGEKFLYAPGNILRVQTYPFLMVMPVEFRVKLYAVYPRLIPEGPDVDRKSTRLNSSH